MAKGGKSEAGEEFGSGGAARARTSRSSSHGGRSHDPGHVAGRPTSASGEAGSGYPTCTCHGSSGSASSICRAGTRSETCGSCSLSAASCELSGEALPSAPKTAPPKLKKLKELYYNIVGEAMPSDED